MLRVAWLTRRATDVPAGDGWLGAQEREVQAGLRVARRREDSRLGRVTAKHAVAAYAGGDPGALEVLAAADGAPEAWLDGRPAPLTNSLSLRAGLAVAELSEVAGGVA